MSYGWNIGDAAKEFINEESNRTFEPSANFDSNEPGYYWQGSSGGVPASALRVGVDKDGGSIFVGRAFHAGDHLPAKVLENHNVAYVAYGGEEHVKREFEVLCVQPSCVIWVHQSGGNVPAGAVACGCTSEGESLFIGRVFHDGTLTPGKIQQSHNCCYIPYDGQELSFPDYEVLLIK